MSELVYDRPALDQEAIIQFVWYDVSRRWRSGDRGGDNALGNDAAWTAYEDPRCEGEWLWRACGPFGSAYGTVPDQHTAITIARKVWVRLNSEPVAPGETLKVWVPAQ